MFEPRGMATGIGSLPEKDASEAVAKVLRYLPECPFWPQLPSLSHAEGMTLQYTARLPGDLDPLRVYDAARDEERAFFEEDAFEKEIAAFYARVLSGEVESFALPDSRATGFVAFREEIRKAPHPPRCLKGHVTGPVTLASALKHHDLEIVHDESLRDVVAQHLAMNARWQVRELKKLGAEEVVIFLDEPSMEAFGSAFSSLSRETVLGLWRPVLDAIREEGALSGIHCCGNTDWALLFECGTDIVNFDAFHFLDKIILYAGEAKRFLQGGGVLAWGIVPTSEEVRGVTVEGLLEKLEEGMARFEKAGLDGGMLRRRCLLTPSCGMGSLSVELSEMVLKTLSELSRECRSRWAAV
jgi:methionine synthase II (cobalamin-independent)